MTTSGRMYYDMSILSGAAYAIGSDFVREMGDSLGTAVISNYNVIDAGRCDVGSLDFGFAAYVFQDISTPTVKTIAFRGTEASPLGRLDPLDLAANTDILTNGVAMQQIVDMYNYVSSLGSGLRAQYRLVATDLPPSEGTPYVTAFSTLRIWRDLDSDGITDTGEHFTHPAPAA